MSSVKIIVIRLQAPEGHLGILFHSECAGVKGPLPTVSLSRTKGKCIFSIDKLHEHDDHTPFHTDKVKANVYCERVLGDIKDALTAKGIKFEIVYTEAQLKQPNPTEIMKDAFAGDCAAWKAGTDGKLIKAPVDGVCSKLFVSKDAFSMPLGTPYIPN